MDARTEAFSPQIYANYPVLDSVLIYYLDIESLIQRHQVNPAAFETRESLNLLAQRFDLPASTTFLAFLDSYDAKYPTVRSYFLPGADPEAIILKAAEAGNLQAFYLGLRLNPEYKDSYVLNQALRLASRAGHQAMIDLIKDLGGTSFKQEVRGTAEGGHLEKLKCLISQGPNLPQNVLSQLTGDAARYGQLAAFKYLTILWTPLPYQWKSFAWAAGESGNQGMIDYVISQGEINYTPAILGAIIRGHLELAILYMDKPGLNYTSIFSQAFNLNYLDLAKLVARDHRINRKVLNELMEYDEPTTTYETIDYLISLGWNNYDGLVNQLAINDQIELFRRYYLGPGVDLIHVLNLGLENSSLEVVKFMLEHQLVPVTPDELNSYLTLVAFNPELIALLFSLGATDYGIIVERGLIQGDLELAEKYFDQALGLKLNAIFKRCTKIPVYQYLLSQGQIKQKTIDTTIVRLKQSTHNHARAERYLRSLSLQDISSPIPG
jgi:hypothetical protein